jgi:hypothetical protein
MQLIFVNPQGDVMVIIGEQGSQSGTPASGTNDSNIKGGVFHEGLLFSGKFWLSFFNTMLSQLGQD